MHHYVYVKTIHLRFLLHYFKWSNAAAQEILHVHATCNFDPVVLYTKGSKVTEKAKFHSIPLLILNMKRRRKVGKKLSVENGRNKEMRELNRSKFWISSFYSSFLLAINEVIKSYTCDVCDRCDKGIPSYFSKHETKQSKEYYYNKRWSERIRRKQYKDECQDLWKG